MVSLCVMCIVLKWQKILTRFLLHLIAACLSQNMLKFGSHQSNLSSPDYTKKWPTLLLCVLAIFNGKLWLNDYREGSGYNGEAIGYHHHSFEWYHLYTSMTSPPFRPGNPALCGSCSLVTPYYCRLGDLLCYSCTLYLSTILCVYAYV